jgi:hypothetical protein
MSAWIVFSVIGHLIVLLILASLGPRAFSSKSNTPLQQQQIIRQKQVFEAQHNQRLLAKVKNMQKAHNDLLEFRNRRVAQYKKLEERMQQRLHNELPKQASYLLALQHEIANNFTTSNARFDSLQSLQESIRKDIQENKLAKAAEKLVESHAMLKKLNTNLKKTQSDLDISTVRLEDMRELFFWINNDSLVLKIDQIKGVQVQLQKELLHSTGQLSRYEATFERKLPKIKRDIQELQEGEKTWFKSWNIKRRLKSLINKNIHRQNTENAAQNQRHAHQDLQKTLDKSKDHLKRGLALTPFPARSKIAGSSGQSSLPNLMQQAQNAKNETLEIYREARAAELALIQNRAYSSAYEKVAQDASFFADRTAHNSPETHPKNQDVHEYKKTFEMAARDMDIILADIQAMRQKAAATRTSVSDSGLTDVSLAMRRHVSQFETLEERAGPHGSQVQDLALDMFRILHPDRAATFRGLHRDITPPQMRLSMQHFGRKITTYGRPVDSFFIDSWYMIGPFPNSHRRHIDDMFPPESFIDLDAEYIGKHGPVRWEYCSSSTHFIKPIHFVEYGIYYAYTELYADQEQAVWMAFGSDDRLDVWINDIKVWQSGNQLKQWRPDEGYRKVYLEQGYNKILARLENGYRECGFSLIVALE